MFQSVRTKLYAWVPYLFFVFGDVKNARDLHLQLRQAAHVVVDEVPGWRIPGLPSTATKLAFTCIFIVKNKKNLFNPHFKGNCLSFSVNRTHNIELRNADYL